MIVANFNKGTTISQIFGLWQYDYGQVLRIQGLNLPTAVEIHFSYQRTGGEAKTRIGMTKDGVTDVVIPDSMLENSDTNQDYKIYAFVYVTDDSSGQTEYCITMNVQSRPKPEAFDRPEDGEIFKEAIQAVRESADQAAESAQRAAEIKDSVQDMVDTIGSIDEQVQAVKGYAEQAKTASSNAALSESKAKESETAAETAKTSAVQSAESARQSAAAVEQVVSGFDEKVSEASTAIENAKTQAVKDVEDKGNEVLQSIPEDFQTQMATKLDKQQGVENAGKPLVVGKDGNVVPGEVSGGGGDGIAIINTMSGASPLVIPDSSERVNKGLSIIGNTVQSQDPPPSPDNPQEIKNVGKWDEEKQKYEVDVKFVDKNIFDVDYFTKNENYKNKEDDTTYWKYAELKVAPNTTFTVSKKKKININGGINRTISYVGGFGFNNDINSVQITSDSKGILYVMFFYRNQDVNILKELEIQIEVGNASTDYEAYTEQTITITSDRPITKWDKLVERDGQIGWLYGGKIIESYNSELIDTEYMSSIGELSVGATVLYKLKIAEFIPLPQSEQEAIRVLKTYYPTTVITADGGEVDPNIKVTYTADTKNYIDQKIESINKAVVTTQKALI